MIKIVRRRRKEQIVKKQKLKEKKAKESKGKYKNIKRKKNVGSLFKKKIISLQNVQTFKVFKFNTLSIPEKSAILRKQLRARHLYKLTLERRLFKLSLLPKGKKFYTFERKLGCGLKKSFKTLLKIYSTNFARFVRRRKKSKKYFKRLLRRHKRKKKWRRRGVFGLFKSRYCFRHKFYIPRHFETNYKTGNMLYLGFNDANSYNFRLPFPVNIRKLATVMAA